MLLFAVLHFQQPQCHKIFSQDFFIFYLAVMWAAMCKHRL